MTAHTRVLAALGLGLILALAAPALADGPVTSPLARAGKWMVDSQGRVVIVHGVNIVHKIAPFYPDNFTDQDARFLANEGFTAARIGFIWAGVEPQPGRYDDAYINKVIGFNQLLARYGIRTLIDFHQDSWSQSAGGDGAPSWATLGGNFLDDFQHFWDNDPAPDGVGIQTHFVNAWRHVVPLLDTSSGAANILGWDPFNEPYAGSSTGCAPFTPCPQFESGQLADFYGRLFTGIRASGDRHMIFPEGIAQNGIAQPSLPKYDDPQAAFTYHYYCPITQTATSSSPADAGCAPYEQHGIGNFESYADSLNTPRLLGEFSCNDADDDNAAMVDLVDGYFTSWTIWQYYTYKQDPANCAGQGLLLDDSKPGSEANAKQAKLDALVVPYPQAIAGTPGSYSFARSSDTMTLTYRATAVPGAQLAPGADTQIFVPERKYPHGYHVSVTGARVVSAPTAPWVELQADPGASVSVTISPATGSTTELPLAVWPPGGAACTKPSSVLRGHSLGPVRLGLRPAQVRRHLAQSCPGLHGIRVAYLHHRVALILTSNRLFSLRGVRVGAPLARASRRLRLGRPYRVGGHAWYLVPFGRVRGVLEVRRGVIQTIGIATARLAASRYRAGSLLRRLS